jgi:SAM-dependent methyltransferase
MSQNIYDDPDFFAGYSQLPRSVHGLAGAGEWPAISAILPPLAGAAVVDLGCGFGWFCRWVREHGAATVLGIDLSANMLARAVEETQDPAISYRRGDLESVELPRREFDLAYSSLTLHYVGDLHRLIGEVARSLRPGGSFVCSVEHPTYTAPRSPDWVHGDGGRIWPLDGYLREGPRTTDWLAPGVVKQHRTIGTYVSLLLDAGLQLTQLVEWGPSDADLAEHPEWEPERDRSPFLILAARSPELEFGGQ